MNHRNARKPMSAMAPFRRENSTNRVSRSILPLAHSRIRANVTSCIIALMMFRQPATEMMGNRVFEHTFKYGKWRFGLQQVRKILIVLEATLDKSIVVLLGRKMMDEYLFFFFSTSVQNKLLNPLSSKQRRFGFNFYEGAQYDEKMCPLSPCRYKKCYTTVLPRDALKLGSGQFQF